MQLRILSEYLILILIQYLHSCMYLHLEIFKTFTFSQQTSFKMLTLGSIIFVIKLICGFFLNEFNTYASLNCDYAFKFLQRQKLAVVFIRLYKYNIVSVCI